MAVFPFTTISPSKTIFPLENPVQLAFTNNISERAIQSLFIKTEGKEVFQCLETL